jgi:hypothetical protein
MESGWLDVLMLYGIGAVQMGLAAVGVLIVFLLW